MISFPIIFFMRMLHYIKLWNVTKFYLIHLIFFQRTVEIKVPLNLYFHFHVSIYFNWIVSFYVCQCLLKFLFASKANIFKQKWFASSFCTKLSGPLLCLIIFCGSRVFFQLLSQSLSYIDIIYLMTYWVIKYSL